ncbi:MAG: hypothetical protein Fur0028_08790 [Bacteroidales bacterium]
MKKLFFIFSFCISIQAFAQITITQYDLPTVNDTIFYKTGNINNFDPNLTGANTTWDFSQLSLNNQRSDTIISVTSTPVVYNVVFNFTIANLAFINQSPPQIGGGLTVSDYYDFYKKSSTYYRKAGFGATINGVQTPVKYDNPELFFKLPLTFGTSDSSISSYGMQIPNNGYYGQTIYRKHEADGWGTIITPYGTYDAIRVKETVNITDTIFSAQFNFGYTINRPTSYEYYWLTNGLKSHVAKVTKSGAINNIEIRFEPATYINNIEDEQLKIFPNPVSENMIIRNLPTGHKTLILVNALGQKFMDCTTLENEIHLNTSHFPCGMYYLIVFSERYSSKQKVVIQH